MSDDDLEVTPGSGYIPGRKHDFDDMGDEEEALARWKKQLGVRDEDFALLEMCVIRPRQPSVIMNFRTENPEEITVTVKEGESYSINISFKVNNQTLEGLKFQQTIRRGVLSEKSSKDLGDIKPSSKAYEKTVIFESAPSGMLARGRYHIVSSLLNKDGHTLAKWNWEMEIRKDY